MKKLFTIFIIAAVLCITGCKQASTTDDNNLTKTIKISKDGEVYLIKLNTTEKTCYEDDTGYVKKVARSAVEENNFFYGNDYYLHEMYKKIIDCIKNDNSRSANNLSHSADDPLIDVYNPTETFVSFINNEPIYDKDKNLIGVDGIPGNVNADCIYNGEHCCIYVDKKNSKIIQDLIDKGEDITIPDYELLGTKFDSFYMDVISILGNPYYDEYNPNFFIPCNTKIRILVSDLYGDAEDDSISGVVGFFKPADLLNQKYLDDNYNGNLTSNNKAYVTSNKCEMFYVDTVFLAKFKEIVYSTLIHEFNHMINFVVKSVNSSGRYACDTWFTEMLAMTTEDMFQNYLGINDENSPKARLSTFGFNYCYGFKNWNNQNVDQLSMYANTYAFGAFLARNFGGIELIKEIAQSSYVDEQAITKAIQKLNPGKTYTDEVTEQTKPWDFTFALRKFPLCVIYTDYGYEWSLNNKTGFTNESKIGFSEINLKQRVEEYQLPVYFYSDKKGCVNILAKGFTVHHVGTNITSFTLTVPKTSKLEYYYVIK